MPVRDSKNSLKVIDHSPAIIEVDNQYGLINSMNMFDMRNTPQTAITFDKIENQITLLPQTSRTARNKTYGKDRKVSTFSLPLAYFAHGDSITSEDIQDHRMPGTDNMQETLANVRVTKLTDMRYAADLTKEYLQLNALTGKMKTPDGAIVADMFAEFGITQTEVDFDLGNSAVDLDSKFTAVKRAVSKGAKTGSSIGGVTMMVDEAFFDALIRNAQFREVYRDYQNSGGQRLRDDLERYENWGVTSVVEHRGVRILAYNPEFLLPDGETTEQVFAAKEGIALPVNARGMYRGYNGPSIKLSQAGTPGQDMFVREYPDPKDEAHELELEMHKLYFATKPAAIIKVKSST